MITSLVGPIAGTDDPILKRMRRSRLSIHMTTPRVRRWLLVQLVSIPVEQQADDTPVPFAQPAAQRANRSYQQLIDDCRVVQASRLMI